MHPILITEQRSSRHNSRPVLATSGSNWNAKDHVGERGGLLLGSRNVRAAQRLPEAISKVEIRVVAGDVAQNHKEGITSKPPGFSLEVTSSSLLMHLHLVDQLIEGNTYTVFRPTS
jgi:hypothetical protein